MTATENERGTQVSIGTARSSGPSVQDFLAADTRTVPASLLDHSSAPQGAADVSKGRYVDAGFAALENEYLWTSTWQMACMEVDLPNPGDHVVYDVADESLIVTRTKDGAIKAFHNSCLHRGTKLRTDDGRVASFRCPFHGWKWDLDGNLVELPAEWDFPQVWEQPDSCLPEAAVATWHGFVFVNMADDPQPFDTYADKLIEHFDRDFDMTGRHRAFWATKEVPANWKVCMEAFGEGYHVIATHPQILEFTADENSEYSIWPDSPHVTRFINGFGAQSPHLAELEPAAGRRCVHGLLGRFGEGRDPGGDADRRSRRCQPAGDRRRSLPPGDARPLRRRICPVAPTPSCSTPCSITCSRRSPRGPASVSRSCTAGGPGRRRTRASWT